MPEIIFGMSDSNGTDVVFEFGKSIYSQLFIDAVQRRPLFIIQTVYLGFYFILWSCKA